MAFYFTEGSIEKLYLDNFTHEIHISSKSGTLPMSRYGGGEKNLHHLRLEVETLLLNKGYSQDDISCAQRLVISFLAHCEYIRIENSALGALLVLTQSGLSFFFDTEYINIDTNGIDIL